MTVYLTKVWGFSEPSDPLQFSLAGWRDRARTVLREDDLVVLVGTLGPETAPADQGRLLGIMEPSTEPANSLDFDVRQSPSDFDENGRYKWPFALLNRRAWALEERPLLKEISERRFDMDAVQGIVAMTGEEAEKIRKLKARPVDLLVAVRASARVVGDEEARKRAAPPPTTTRTGIMHMRRAPAFTYCMELEGAAGSAFKVGWAFDYKVRERQFNQAAMPKLGGIRYRTRLHHLWDTARQAFSMEQSVLGWFADQLHPVNREVIRDVTYKEIEKAWVASVSRLSRR